VVEEDGDKYRDTLVCTVRGDGAKMKAFLIKHLYGNAAKATGRRPQPGEKIEKGMTKLQMKKYIDHLVPQLEHPSLLILDLLSSHKSNEVKQYAESKTLADGRQALYLRYLKPKTAFICSPLDNGFIPLVKTPYYKMDRSTLPLKFRAATQCYYAVPDQHVRNIVDNCGYTSEETPQALQKRFKESVIGSVPEHLAECLELYDAWRSRAVDVPGAAWVRDIPLQKPEQLSEAELNGVYWCNWGRHGKKL
jgi:hypothetical protein